MKILKWNDPEILVLDMDGTLYDNPAYLEEATGLERQAISQELGWPLEEARQRIETRRKDLSNGVRATTSSVVYSFGLTLQWWCKVRAGECYFPEKHLQKDPRLRDALLRISQSGYGLAVATNSPDAVARRVLACLGLDDIFRPNCVYAPEHIGCSKPETEYYSAVARRLGHPPSSCVSIGDREDADGIPALYAGMGAVIVSGPEELVQFLEGLRRCRRYWNSTGQEAQ